MDDAATSVFPAQVSKNPVHAFGPPGNPRRPPAAVRMQHRNGHDAHAAAQSVRRLQHGQRSARPLVGREDPLRPRQPDDQGAGRRAGRRDAHRQPDRRRRGDVRSGAHQRPRDRLPGRGEGLRGGQGGLAGTGVRRRNHGAESARLRAERTQRHLSRRVHDPPRERAVRVRGADAAARGRVQLRDPPFGMADQPGAAGAAGRSVVRAQRHTRDTAASWTPRR